MGEEERIKQVNKDVILFLQKQGERGEFMNPVLKRFLKGLGAAVLATGLTYGTSFLTSNPMLLGSMTPILTALLLAAEKAFPQNM